MAKPAPNANAPACADRPAPDAPGRRIQTHRLLERHGREPQPIGIPGFRSPPFKHDIQFILDARLDLGISREQIEREVSTFAVVSCQARSSVITSSRN